MIMISSVQFVCPADLHVQAQLCMKQCGENVRWKCVMDNHVIAHLN